MGNISIKRLNKIQKLKGILSSDADLSIIIRPGIGKILRFLTKIQVDDSALQRNASDSCRIEELNNVKINLNSIKDRSFVYEVSKQITHLENEIRRKEKQVLSKADL